MTAATQAFSTSLSDRTPFRSAFSRTIPGSSNLNVAAWYDSSVLPLFSSGKPLSPLPPAPPSNNTARPRAPSPQRRVLSDHLRIRLLHLDQRDALHARVRPLDPPELHVHVASVPLHPIQ